MASLNLTAQDQAWIVIGKQYGAYVYLSGTAEQLINARDFGRQIEIRLQAVGGDLSWTLQQLEYAEKPNAVPQMPTISVNNISNNAGSVNWTPYQYDKPQVTGFHFVLKNQDTGQTIVENNLMSGARNFYVSNLDSGTNYKGYLIAINSIGNSPENSIGFKTLGSTPVEPPVVVPPPIIISTEVQAILNKFNNNDYTYPTWFNSNIGFVKNGSITNQEFLNTFNSLLQDGIIVDKTVVIPPIQLNPDNFLPNGNVRVIRVTGILANDYEVTDGVALANLQSYLDSGVFRLLTQAELDYVAPPVVVPPVVVPKEYDVNTYRINQFGGVYNEIIYGIDDNRLLQLESQFLVTLVGSPTPSDQEVKDFYNYIDIDTSVKSTMVSQRFLAFKIVDGYLQGNIQYVATGSFNPHYNNKIIYSVIQVQDSNGNFILIGNEPKKTIKVNELRFTSSQIDEKININEYVGDIEAVTIQAFVSTKPDLITGEFFTGIISLEVVKDDGKTCPTGYHLGFNGKCVLDGGEETGGSTSILGKVMGVTALLGTLALLGAKRR
jgi:hypothetical protein